MGGLKVRCGHCGWVDGQRVVYVILAVVLLCTIGGAVAYVKSESLQGGAVYNWGGRNNQYNHGGK